MADPRVSIDLEAVASETTRGADHAISPNDETHRHAALDAGTITQSRFVTQPETTEVLTHDAPDGLGGQSAACARLLKS